MVEEERVVKREWFVGRAGVEHGQLATAESLESKHYVTVGRARTTKWLL